MRYILLLQFSLHTLMTHTHGEGAGMGGCFFSAHVTLVNHFCRIRKKKRGSRRSWGHTHTTYFGNQDLRSWTPRSVMKAESAHFLLSSSCRCLCLFTQLFFIWTKKHGNVFFDIQTLRMCKLESTDEGRLGPHTDNLLVNISVSKLKQARQRCPGVPSYAHQDAMCILLTCVFQMR